LAFQSSQSAIIKHQLLREQPTNVFSISVVAVAKAISPVAFSELLYL
jgi:hypothetical protein